MLRKFSQLRYLKPEPVLYKLRVLERRLKTIEQQSDSGIGLDDKVLRLRTSKLKEPREARLSGHICLRNTRMYPRRSRSLRSS